MDFYAYLLRCSNGKYYVGHTDNLDFRIAQHQSGALGGWTSKYRPVELVWSEQFPERDQAFAAERQLKGWSRAKKEALIRGDWEAVRALSSRSLLRDAASPSSAAPQDERIEAGGTAPPIIILIRPQLGENIGKAARAMLNFGLTELRLVAPRDGWPNPSAGPAASGADVVLEQARVYATAAEAVADCAHVYATTVRKRGVTKPVLTPEAAARDIHAAPGRSAILFGAERSGLETEDVALARSIVTVPINPEFGSLNLAQAVILLAYEWSKQADLVQPTAAEALPPAPQAELDGLIDHLDRLLEPTGYFLPPERAGATRRTLRGVLTKPGWNSLEIRTLRGVLSALSRR
ncbi:GIY-YIG nuclease family protein [Sphingomonas sp. ID1715]|uniref:TrmH family RNA methyltransferase n=1 Tax=Sphingomonas sp. ID1715 TaxID=1656898 RepID=UPI00148776CB|nr:TrmH family RNA methyltransferase [Sphingomonas sp. ID1715]NNM77600.1 GIY-YIG nuclease family protein [Sphingomonas sp. ID1715]